MEAEADVRNAQKNRPPSAAGVEDIAERRQAIRHQ